MLNSIFQNNDWLPHYLSSGKLCCGQNQRDACQHESTTNKMRRNFQNLEKTLHNKNIIYLWLKELNNKKPSHGTMAHKTQSAPNSFSAPNN